MSIAIDKLGNDDKILGVEQNKKLSFFRKLLSNIRIFTNKRALRLRNWVFRFPNAKPTPREGRDADLIKLMCCLHKIEEISPKEFRTDAGTWIPRTVKVLRIGYILLFIVIVIACILVKSELYKAEMLLPLATITFTIFMILVLLSILINGITTFFCFIFAYEFDFHIRRIELTHDLRMASELRDFDINILKAGEQWMGIKLERLKFRMLLLFGGSDKLGVFGLVGLAWAMWKSMKAESTLLAQDWVGFFLAGLGGMVLGGILINALIQRLAYQREIITLAIREREEVAMAKSVSQSE